VLTRASYAGGQRYAMTWTGDNDSTWNHLKLSVPMIENLGLSGFAWSGANVGGFSASPSAEPLTRWIEVAAVTPLFRDHAAKGTAPREPWVDGPEQTTIRRRFIAARYRLTPCLYAHADETARTGLPVMRPVLFEFPAMVANLRDAPQVFIHGDRCRHPRLDADGRDDSPWRRGGGLHLRPPRARCCMSSCLTRPGQSI